MLNRIYPGLLLVVVLVISTFIYYPGLSGPFVFDDGVNIVDNPHLRLDDLSKGELAEAASSVPNGMFGRPLSMLSFAFNFYIDRDESRPSPSAYPFKVFNISIHLLNGISVFALSFLLVGFICQHGRFNLPRMYPHWLALAVATAWSIHPLNLTSVLYVVQRMTSLSAFFTFVGLVLYSVGRIRLLAGKNGGRLAILSGFFICTPLAFLSKENGILLPVFMLLLEVLVFQFQGVSSSDRRFLIWFFVLFVIGPVLVALVYFIWHPDWLMGGYARRDFSLGERLLTEARVLWFYLRLILLPSSELMGICHDDIAISRDLFTHVTTLPSLVGIVVLLGVAFCFRKAQPLVALGIAFFFLGHVLESTVFPLELTHEHRNYLPIFGILLAFFHLLLNPLMASSTRFLRWSLALILIPLFAFVTWSRAEDWSSSSTLWSAEVRHHPNSIRANTAMGDLFANALAFQPEIKTANYEQARYYYEQVLSLNKYNTDALFKLLNLSDLHGKPVDQFWLGDLEYGLKREAIPSNTNDRLIALSICLIKGECPLSAKDVESLLITPLSNPKVVGRDRALIYNALVFYQFNVIADYTKAAEYSRSAMALDPQDMEHHLSLISCLIAMNNLSEANHEIVSLKKLDRYEKKAKEIALLENKISGIQ